MILIDTKIYKLSRYLEIRHVGVVGGHKTRVIKIRAHISGD